MPRQLTPQHEALIGDILTVGNYRDPDLIITDALQQLAAREQNLQKLKAKIQIGLDQLDRGEGLEWTPDLMDTLLREADEMFHRGEQPNPDVCP